MPKKQTRSKMKKIVVPRNCPFCKEGTNPNFLDVKSLEKYITERGKVIGGQRTGLCSLHQRRVTRAIKYARHLALLPFVQRV